MTKPAVTLFTLIQVLVLHWMTTGGPNPSSQLFCEGAEWVSQPQLNFNEIKASQLFQHSLCSIHSFSYEQFYLADDFPMPMPGDSTEKLQLLHTFFQQLYSQQFQCVVIWIPRHYDSTMLPPVFLKTLFSYESTPACGIYAWMARPQLQKDSVAIYMGREAYLLTELFLLSWVCTFLWMYAFAGQATGDMAFCQPLLPCGQDFHV